MRLHPGLLAEQRLGHRRSLTVLIVVPPNSPPERIANLEQACAEAGERSTERLLPLWAHDIAPGRLAEIVSRRVHVAVLAAHGDPAVAAAIALVAEAGMPHLVLISAATAGSIGALLPAPSGEVVAPRDAAEARASTAAFLVRAAAEGDELRRRYRPMLHNGLNATRQRSLRGWETLPETTRRVIAACNGMRAAEVQQLLQDSHATQQDDTIKIAQLEIDIRQARDDLSEPLDGPSALEAVELQKFDEFCHRQRLDRDGPEARRLRDAGEWHARRRAQKQAAGASARRSFRHWTAWAELWDEL